MGYVYIPDDLPWRPNVLELRARTFMGFIRAVCWCSRQLADGVVPPVIAKTWCGLRKLDVDALVAAGLCHRLPDGAVVINDYLEWNPSKAEVLAAKEIAARRAAIRRDPELTRQVKERDHGRCRYCGIVVDWQDRRGPKGGSYDHVIPVSQGGDDSLENLVTACRTCNSGKGGRRPEECSYVLRPPGYQKITSNGTGKEPVENLDSPQVAGAVPPRTPPPISPSGSDSSPDPEGISSYKPLNGTDQVARATQKPSRKQREITLPDGWKPNEKHAAKARQIGLVLDLETERFRERALAKGLRYVDWDRAFNTWLLSPYAQPVNGKPPGFVDHESRRIEANTRADQRQHAREMRQTPTPSLPAVERVELAQQALAALTGGIGKAMR